MNRVAIISTHPIQYNAPWFKLLHDQADIEVKVFYTWSQRYQDMGDKDFGIEIRWDIPLLEGYEFSFVPNDSKDPGNHHFRGINCPALNREIRQWNPTHLLVMGWNFRAHLKAMRFFKGRIPVMFRGDSTLLDESNPLKSMVRRLALKWVYRYVDAALPVGSSNQDYFLAHGLSKDRLFFAPHAIENRRFIADQTRQYDIDAREWRLKLGIMDSDRVILYAGKFIHKKAPSLLIKAFKKLKQDDQKEVKLLFVGNGPLEKELRMISSRDPDILFLPFQNQSKMPLVYRLGDMLCLPSSGPGETWGLAVNEAMACGKPCLLSDRTGSAADLGKYPGNQVFRSGDVNDLTSRLSDMLKNDGFENLQFLDSWNYPRLVDGILSAMQYTSTT